MKGMMSSQNVIDLCSDEEEKEDNNTNNINNLITEPNEIEIPFCEQAVDHHEGSASRCAPLQFHPTEDLQFPASRLCRQFWKAGDYAPPSSNYAAPSSAGGQNRFRVHPKFLHSNATSHKWAFGAIAELLDNAIDEVKTGATFVKLDKIQNHGDGKHALLIQDDGGGMNPGTLRRCISFGFSDKCDGTSIGQYGNGFKTSTMRLGADALVFSRTSNEGEIIQSVGLLSYTFLTTMGFDDIIVPIVDYEYDSAFGTFKRQFRNGERQFLYNLSIILDWSPFVDEMQLLNQLNEIGAHGTRIIVYNLWFNDAGDLELDFTSDQTDILINGAPKHSATKNEIKLLNENHVANRFRYSLRAYASILYLHLPEKFRIILCGTVVEPHYIVSDLIFRECIKYNPHGYKSEADVITTIGFLNGAPNLNIHGFNIYHKNRLILPFWVVAMTRKCRGIAGVLEANFIKPTHDKQDFERSTLFLKLEARLKQMAFEYWKFHCHLVGYKAETPVVIRSQTPHETRVGPTTANDPLQFLNEPNPPSTCFEPVIIGKRRSTSKTNASGESKRQAVTNDFRNEQEEQRRLDGYRILVSENKKLQSQCLEYEMAEKELSLKVQRLTSGLENAQQVYRGLLTQLDSLTHHHRHL